MLIILIINNTNNFNNTCAFTEDDNLRLFSWLSSADGAGSALAGGEHQIFVLGDSNTLEPLGIQKHLHCILIHQKRKCNSYTAEVKH